MNDSVRLTSRRTYFLEKRRALPSGILDAANTSFLLIIAVRHFDAGPTAKGFIASGSPIGLLLSPLVLFIASKLELSLAKAAALLMFGSACMFLVTAANDNQLLFVVCSVAALATYTSCVPLVTQIFRDNYEDHERGSLFSRTTSLKLLASSLFGAVGGFLLSERLEVYPALLLIFAISSLYACYIFSLYPSRKLNKKALKFLAGFADAKTDRVFRLTLFCWMLVGFGNLMMLPLRVEYLANPRYGLQLSAFAIATYVTVIPSVVRLILTPAWGKLFDTLNFFRMRILLNVGFLIGFAAFFVSDSVVGLVLGAVIIGVSNAGGDVAWYLWVTKLAPQEKVADYMAVHTFLTGVRGLLAPLLSFHLASMLPITYVAAISAGLIVLSCVFLLPEAKANTHLKKN